MSGFTDEQGSDPVPSGTMTPGGIAAQLSKLELPAPSNLRLNLPPSSAQSPLSPSPFSASTQGDGDLDGPEPEAIVQARYHARSESMSEQLSATLSKMKFPQPERIFGPEADTEAEGSGSGSGESKPKREGVSADDWAKVTLEDDVPEAVKEPVRMTHSRNASRVGDFIPTPRSAAIPEVPEEAKPSADAAGPVEKEQKITPFEVEGGVDAEGKSTGIDYDKVVKQFGAKLIEPELLERFERLTGVQADPLLRRGTFFSHRDLNLILDRYEKKQPFYLYTGRGPSSDSMHMGHLIPFRFTAWLQKVFNCPLVIQITDDEKYLLQRDVKKQADIMKKIKAKKPIELLRHYKKMGQDNIRDIIAVGFIKEKTFIFSDLQYVGGAFYENVVLLGKSLTLNQSKNIFGFTDSDNVGMFHFAAIQATPSFSNSFPQIFGERDDIPCLIPCAIDQDPYFLFTRDAADKLGYRKPALLHAKFLPALQGANTKMSASNENSAIFMTDDPKKIAKKIKSHAFSGGGATQEEHQRLGGVPEVDVAYQYLSFFEPSDEKMDRLAKEYRAGTLSTSQMKEECIAMIQGIVGEFQEARAAITAEDVAYYQDFTRKIDPSVAPRAA